MVVDEVSYLAFSPYQLVLICCYSDKTCLGELESLCFFGVKVNNRGGVITLSDNVHSGLILMHGVQNNLFKETYEVLQRIGIMLTS